MSNIDEYHDALRLINYANEKLIDVISLLYQVGMKDLSGRIYNSHEQIDIAVSKIEKYVDGLLDQEYKNANESSNLVLKLALAGCLKSPDLPPEENPCEEIRSKEWKNSL